jgi:DNA-binding transcriptional MerR regulator
MYTIKRAAERAGVPPATLRAWERRYGIVRPARSEAGYRLYDDAAVARLHAMRGLIADGWSASAAAQAVISGTLPTSASSPGDRPRAQGGVIGSDQLVEQLLGAAHQLDAAALSGVLDEMFVRAQFEVVATQLLFPALRALGDAWARGEVSVAGEHLVSQAVLRRISAAFDAAGEGPAAEGSIVVGLPAGSLHEIGALAFATVARRRGLPVTYVGADLPLADWVRATAGARAAVIGMVTARDRGSALETANAVRAAHARIVVALGGAEAARVAGGLGFRVLPEAPEDAVRELRSALAGGT